MMGKAAIMHGKARTIRNDRGDIVAIIGVISVDNGVGTLWMLGTDLISKHPKSFSATLVPLRDMIIDRMQLHRLQCDVVASQMNWVKWTKTFGFEIEGKLRKFRRGEDVYILGYIPN